MIRSRLERERAWRKLVGLRYFERRVSHLIENLQIDYKEPLVNARVEIESLEASIKEFDEISIAKPPRVTTEMIRELPKFLIQSRLKLGWTQTELGRRVGVSPQVIHRWEKDYLQVKPCFIIKLIEVMQEGFSDVALKRLDRQHSENTRDTS